MATDGIAMLTTEHAVREREVVVNRLRLHYLEWGNQDAPAVLLLHGLTGNAWEWEDVGIRLADRYRVVALNQRGHGDSAWASEYTPDLMVNDVVGVINELGLAPVGLVGHSMGGIHAYRIAAWHPELVERLAIVDFGPGVGSEEFDLFWHTTLTAMANAAFDEPDTAIAEWQAMNPLAQERELRRFITHNLQQAADGTWRWKLDGTGLIGWVENFPDSATDWAALRKIACPTLLVRGEQSLVISPELAARMIDELAEGELVEIRGGAHDLTVERPAELVDELERFLTH